MTGTISIDLDFALAPSEEELMWRRLGDDGVDKGAIEAEAKNRITRILEKLLKEELLQSDKELTIYRVKKTFIKNYKI